MPTQKELLDGAKKDDLLAFAEEHEVDLQGAKTKEEIIERLASSPAVPKAVIEEEFGEYDDEEEVDEDEGTEPTDEAEDTEDAEDEEAEDGSSPTVTATRVTRSPEAVMDPALMDPEGVARDRVEGRTSDPATRQEGTTADEVQSDINVGPKQSDAGPEQYPFPPQGDVDVSLLDSSEQDGEYTAPLTVEDWVVLDGSHELVPDRLDGHIAYVIDAPSEAAPDVHDHPNAALTPVKDAAIHVRTRDEVDAQLFLPMDAFKTVGRGGRSAVLPHG